MLFVKFTLCKWTQLLQTADRTSFPTEGTVSSQTAAGVPYDGVDDGRVMIIVWVINMNAKDDGEHGAEDHDDSHGDGGETNHFSCRKRPRPPPLICPYRSENVQNQLI